MRRHPDQPGESRMTPSETSYGGPPTGTTLHIKRPREPHCRIIAIGAGGSVCIPSVLTSFCWLLMLLLLLLLFLRRTRSRYPLHPPRLSVSISPRLIFFFRIRFSSSSTSHFSFCPSLICLSSSFLHLIPPRPYPFLFEISCEIFLSRKL